MNSGVSNCIEVHKFWHYLTDLGTNISDRDQIVYLFFKSVFNYSKMSSLVQIKFITEDSEQTQTLIIN